MKRNQISSTNKHITALIIYFSVEPWDCLGLPQYRTHRLTSVIETNMASLLLAVTTQFETLQNSVKFYIFQATTHEFLQAIIYKMNTSLPKTSSQHSKPPFTTICCCSTQLGFQNRTQLFLKAS